MAMNVVLVPQRQSPKGMGLSWGAMEGVGHHLIFVGNRKLSPEELEAVEALGGTDDCVVVKVGAEVVAVVDDLSPAGEARYYGVAMVFTDGAVRSARFRAVPDGAAEGAVALSSRLKGGAAKPAAARPAAAAAPAARPAGAPAPAPAARPASISGAPAAPAARPATPAAAPAPRPAAPPPSAAPAAEEDPLEARKRAQREARARMEAERAAASGGAPAEAAEPSAREAAPPEREEAPPSRPAAPPPAAEEDPMEARKRAQREARERAAAASGGEAPAARAAEPAAEEDPLEARKRQQAAARAARDGGGGGEAASSAPPPQPNTVPLEESVEARMSGGTQTWDGLRIYWERAGGPVAAYEVVVSDHQIFGDELADALAGKADFTCAVAVAPSVTAVIDNITPRESRGWYLVLTRAKDGARAAHPFKVGDAAESGKPVAPFVNPNRTGELRAEVEDLLGQARENWDRWKSEQDRGSQREAKRLVGDALLIFPNYPGAKALADEIG